MTDTEHTTSGSNEEDLWYTVIKVMFNKKNYYLRYVIFYYGIILVY